jgi:hypothetical protein
LLKDRSSKWTNEGMSFELHDRATNSPARQGCEDMPYVYKGREDYFGHDGMLPNPCARCLAPFWATAISTDDVVHGLTPFEIWLGLGLGPGVLVTLVQMAGIQLAEVLATQRSPNAPSPQNQCTSPPAGARRCRMDSSTATRGIWPLPDRCAASCASAGCRR